MAILFLFCFTDTLFAMMDMPKFKDGRIHFRNSEMKGLRASLDKQKIVFIIIIISRECNLVFQSLFLGPIISKFRLSNFNQVCKSVKVMNK